MQKKKPQAQSIDTEKAEAFISEANFAPTEQEENKANSPYPWDNPRVRDDVTKAFQVRLPEGLFLKLKYIAENTPRSSMNKICLEAIETVVEAELKIMTK